MNHSNLPIGQINTQYIAMDSPTFYKIVDEACDRILDKVTPPPQHEYWTQEFTLQYLGIKKGLLHKLKNEGEIRYSMLSPKVFLYERDSILEFLESKKISY